MGGAASESQLRVSVPLDLRERIVAVADHNGVSQSVVVRAALQRMFALPGPQLQVDEALTSVADDPPVASGGAPA